MKKWIQYIETNKAIEGYDTSKLAKSECKDCVVRTIASACGLSYDKSHSFVEKKFNRKFRKATYYFSIIMNQISKINRKTVKSFSSSDLMNGKSQMTVGSFLKLYDKGTYIIEVKGHVFTIKNGDVIGNYKDSIKLKRIIKGVWKVGK